MSANKIGKFLFGNPMLKAYRLSSAKLQQCLPCSRTIYLSSQTLNHSPDYYAVLGLNKAATTDQVKMAYFKMAKKYHPDTNPTEEAKWMFRLTAEAYDVLADEKKRKSFDEIGTAGFTYGGTAGGPERPFGHENYDSEELFDKIFGEAGKIDDEPKIDLTDHAVSFDGHDSGKEYKVHLSFEDAAKGVLVHMYLSIKCICPKCLGSKSEMGFTWQVCVYCEGTGIETEKVGHVLVRKTCGYCNGTRQFIKYKCDECEGKGQTIQNRPQSIIIPPGCENGQVLKVPVDASNLRMTIAQETFFYVYVTVDDSQDFKKDEYDILSETDVSISQALLGGTTIVKGLHKDVLEVRVPPFTDSHQSLVALGEGILRSDGLHKGNHYVKVGIRPPKVLTERQRLIWTEFAKLEELESGGTVDGVETVYSHKFSGNVVEAKETRRSFNVKNNVTSKEESSANPEKKNMFQNFFS